MSRITKPTNLTLGAAIKEMARDLQTTGRYKSLTSLVEDLLRQKHQEVFGTSPTSAASSTRAERAEASEVLNQEDNSASSSGESSGATAAKPARKAGRSAGISRYPKKKPSRPKSKAN